MNKQVIAILMVLTLIGIMFTVMLMNVGANGSSTYDPEWVARYHYARYDYARDIAVGPSGNIYVTGDSDANISPYYDDYATVAYSPNGKQLWVARYNGPRNRNDYGKAIAVDSQERVFVTGDGFYSSSSNPDYITVAYDGTTGKQLWVNNYDGPGKLSDYGRAIAVDSTLGRVYVSGYSYGLGTYYDYATVAYDAANGKQLWVARYHYYRYEYSYENSLAIDSNGNVYVTGQSDAWFSSYDDYATVAYSPSGVQLWVARYNAPRNQNDYAKAIAIDLKDNIYVFGQGYFTSSTYSDLITVSYSSSGTQRWVAAYDSPYNLDDYASDIAVDSANNVYVVGYGYYSSSSTYDYITISYSSSGTQRWVENYNGPYKWYDYGRRIAVSLDDKIYVTGQSYGIGTFYDYATVAYNSYGKQLWVGRYNGPVGSTADYGYGIATDAEGNVYMTGYSYGTRGKYYDYATLKYVPAIPATAEMEPKSINLDSMGNYVSIKVEGFPDNPEYSPLDVDGNTVEIEGIECESKYGTWNDNKYITKADRLLVEDAIGAPGDEVELEVTGKLIDGTKFKGIAIIEAHQNL